MNDSRPQAAAIRFDGRCGHVSVCLIHATAKVDRGTRFQKRNRRLILTMKARLSS